MSLVTIQRSTLRAAPKRLDVARQIVSAEFLKVRKRRGLTAWASILTVGIVVGAAGVLAILHAASPVRYGPAGGLSNLANAAFALSALGAVAAVLVGATMGAGDLQAGVFRDLVATGRSRLALFAARIPGGLGLLWPLMAASWAIASAGSLLLAGSDTKPSLSVMVEGGLWVITSSTVVYLLSLGLASLVGSRSATVGALLAWQFLVSPLAVSVSVLGAIREGLLTAALDRTIPAGLLSGVRPDPVSATMSIGTAIAVLVAWSAVPLAAGAWRTKARDA